MHYSKTLKFAGSRESIQILFLTHIVSTLRHISLNLTNDPVGCCRHIISFWTISFVSYFPSYVG